MDGCTSVASDTISILLKLKGNGGKIIIIGNFLGTYSKKSIIDRVQVVIVCTVIISSSRSYGPSMAHVDNSQLE